ncbi:GNAT family N-acetyltransferase [Tetragenococcus koreensis]|uniref:GNAT family acetyltransferase n=1 Tax=Tetragenococcus koreensis TaxID=290335 RepID=A0AAN4ZT85_9ENTE|nr:GNAT family N-acetyltransferase [Tetragenococcus koreensis]MCF1616128.1 GNAT family N-acetyltransferase [Tetragenococcus koreensis]MCF1618520.1 GNAT family N-acetyltransferase [Tetragenococcus koreensis]MCF1621193.1 GNAT family N-acetyltransferase [Tetragenococcus koreensis]MCF1627112.1 GNAT family N-acetyltransferase [Tetragenococcus koreensis]MCF1632098.1 GNAT family N-acetyltransferase [Tetragenococcus koreensis]
MLETNRLIIRNFKDDEKDIEALYKIMSEIEINKYLPWFPINNKAEAFDFYKERILPKYQENNGYYFSICLKSNNYPIGYITVNNEKSHDFGYGLKKEFWRQEITTEAARKVIEFLIQADWKYITATHDINNVASGKVLKKLGMKYKYTYKEQWQPKDILVTFRMYQLNFDGKNRVYEEYWNMYDDHFVENIN